MIKVTYYYSACVAITTPDVSILCDPWFTDGIYDGSWYQYPKVINPIEVIGKHDIIYVSHIHPDHYDPVFLREYLKVYPDTEIIIAPGIFLDKKMDVDGIPYTLCVERIWIEPTHIAILKNDTGSISDIDTALIVRYKDNAVVNMNDNQYYQEQINDIKAIAPNIDIALLGYTGAGPYPQTYYRDHEILEEKAFEKKRDFFRRYLQMSEALDAKVNIPFAGQYILGGRLSHLNKWRGVADATEVLAFDEKAVVLAEGASIDTESLTPTLARIIPYNERSMEAYASSLTIPMDYMTDFKYLCADQVPWGRLLSKAFSNAFKKNEFDGEYDLAIKFADKCFGMNLKTGGATLGSNDMMLKEPYSVIEIDYRYLFGLITGVYHWNNAEVGSQYMTTRVPDKYNRSVQRFLNFFVV